MHSPLRAGRDHRRTCCCAGGPTRRSAASTRACAPAPTSRSAGGSRTPAGPSSHRPQAWVAHHHVETLAALARQCRRHAAGRAWLNRRYPGAAPRPPLTRRLLHALGGALYRARPAAGRAGPVPGNRRALVLLRQRRLPAGEPDRRPMDAGPSRSLGGVADPDGRPLRRLPGALGDLRRVRGRGRWPARPPGAGRVGGAARAADPIARARVAGTQLEDDGIAAKLPAWPRSAAATRCAAWPT